MLVSTRTDLLDAEYVLKIHYLCLPLSHRKTVFFANILKCSQKIKQRLNDDLKIKQNLLR